MVKQFSGISVREQGSVKIIKKYLGIEPNFVLDPTFLLDKSDYLKLINNYKSFIDLKKKYLCVYLLDKTNIIIQYIARAKKELNYSIINIRLSRNNYIEEFI